jgi:hypothetical protein
MKKLLIYYSFILTSIMAFSGFFAANNTAEVISAAFFLPLPLYFLKYIIPRRKNALILPVIKSTPKPSLTHENLDKTEPEELKPVKLQKKLDIDRRMFIKLIGSAGISIFLLSIFTKRAQAAFFGSVPGPGTVALKDTTGAQIDPAVEHPTDKYKISEVDDSTPAYYGFVDRTGNWYILQENSDGTYRYVKGASSFSTNWTNRTGLSYDYYYNVFNV